jgi:TrwC relaxase
VRAQPATKDGRRILYDFTFDAPKSVSVAFEVGGDERVLDAFQNSVRETMAEMEAGMATRVRGGGEDCDRRTSNMVWAEFVHRTTRPVDGVPDPQLHCHAVTFNATYDPVEDAGRRRNLAIWCATRDITRLRFIRVWRVICASWDTVSSAMATASGLPVSINRFRTSDRVSCLLVAERRFRPEGSI